MKLRFTIIFAVLFLTEIVFGQFFPNWTFISGTLVTANKILLYFSFSGLLFCVALLFKAKRRFAILWGLILLVIFIINSIGEIYPIDTTTNPVDIKTLKTFKNGEKLVVRDYENAKTNEKIQDTVLVKDIFIFRRLNNK